MLFAGAPEDDIDWAEVSPTGSVKWLARVWRLSGDIGAQAHGEPDPAVRRGVHKLIAAATAAMDDRRLNVAIARLMELTNLLRKTTDTGAGPGNPATREGVEALIRMLSCFAPFTAEEAWQRLGREPSVASAGWPTADPEPLIEDTVVCVIQVNGKLRDKIEVSPSIGEASLRELALGSDRLRDYLAGAQIKNVIVRAPKLVNVVVE